MNHFHYYLCRRLGGGMEIIMYEKYLKQLDEAGKIRNLKERSITCYKNYVLYFLNYMEKNPEELTCLNVRDFLLTKKEAGLKATPLNPIILPSAFFIETYCISYGMISLSHV